MNEQNYDAIKAELEKRLNADFDKYFKSGLMAGFDIAIRTVYEETKGMTSAKKILKAIKRRMDEVENRAKKKEDSTNG